MRELVRKYPRFFILALLAAVALRLIFLFRFPSITVDSLSYGDIAKNWMQHGIYGLSGPKAISPTYTRLPGYPVFLALIFSIFGMEHYRAVLVVQLFVDLGTCFLIADLARRLISPRAARVAFLLAALCPFLANYAAAALTETLEIFFTVVALDCAVIGLTTQKARSPWILCGLATGAAILLRPDGGLLLVVIEAYLLLLWGVAVTKKSQVLPSPKNIFGAALVVLLLSVAPLVPWTVRNLKTLHDFEPLTSRYANEAHEFVPLGFNRWVKTWIVDYASVEEIYWQVPDGTIDAAQLPSRAFDSAKQRLETEKLLADYNSKLRISPAMDSRFAAVAEERVDQSPLRYYIWLPALRIADMWLRPRTEILPSDIRWWEFNDDPKWMTLAIALGIINLFYVAAAIVGGIYGKFGPHFALLLAFVVVRSLFLGTLENPEPRYVLECYPAVIVLASALFLGRSDREAVKPK